MGTKLNKKGFSTVEILLVILIVLVLALGGWLVYKNNHKTKKTTTTSTSTNMNNMNMSSASTTNSTSSSNSINVAEMGVKIILNSWISKDNVSYTFTNGSNAANSSLSQITLKNSKDPLVATCNSDTLVLTKESKDQATYLAPGTVPSYDSGDTKYGAKFVVGGYYYFEAGPNASCNGDYSIFKDPQHNIISSIESL